MFKRVEEFIPVIGTICQCPVHRVLLPTVLLGLVEEGNEHLVILYRFIRDLQTENLVGLDIDHEMHLDPTTMNPPFLAHPLSSIRDLDPGAISGNDDIFGKDGGRYFEREIQIFDSAKEGGIVCRLDTRNECREFSDKTLHLAVG